ncbi:MAG: arginine--tRNA ligase [Candidatus Staskawiczbacteria bacterium RIFCSPHIGHO2_02_FULL_42_22]|uniref:Arginine--tRNA ligase n=1 Tax=Candidatus Staskawiczbacteria bacterium RIFCSPHIGHO2_02_FULL_42_22 TaxID=1802207 RepID=A0A1G2I3G7_9BACT|nr:MAG: arginine--tRNA ligase [Candidatus Staskawiczbacteria bacterium RIFCSPHIGHO2_02_FULL_42_22]
MNVKVDIQKIIKKTVSNLYSDLRDRANQSIDVSVEKPKEAMHGDYSTNIALVLAKQLKKNPNDVAQKIVSEINQLLIRENKQSGRVMFKKVEVVGGFINFFINDEIFNKNIKGILKNKHFGKNQHLKNQKVMVEYTDPNILKEFHIGHLMSNTIGESISRIFEFQGAKVKRVNYQGDVGLHVAKAIWGKKNATPPPLSDEIKNWAFAYGFGSQMYEGEKEKKEIEEINKKIYDRSDPKINALYDSGRKISIEYFETIYKKLGTKFDYYFFESEVADFGKKIVEKNLGKVFEKGENGAIIFKGEKAGLHTRVFINSEGLPTYEAKDLALPQMKYGNYKYDRSIIVTASEQNEYFKVMLCALAQISPKLASKTLHIGHGMMRLPEGKMSSRMGKVITGETLLKSVEELVEKKLQDRDIPKIEKDTIVENVAVGAIKYSILKQSIGSDIIYDVDKSVAFEGDSGPYLQYSLARAISVLAKAKAEKIKPSLKKAPNEVSFLVKHMHYFPEIVEKAGKEFEPHYLVTYLTELASAFNSYYAQNKIVDKTDDFSPYKLAVVEAFTVIMKNGLWLLGIHYLEKM